jgi:hypothetical protein
MVEDVLKFINSDIDNYRNHTCYFCIFKTTFFIEIMKHMADHDEVVMPERYRYKVGGSLKRMLPKASMVFKDPCLLRQHMYFVHCRD